MTSRKTIGGSSLFSGLNKTLYTVMNFTLMVDVIQRSLVDVVLMSNLNGYLGTILRLNCLTTNTVNDL